MLRIDLCHQFFDGRTTLIISGTMDLLLYITQFVGRFEHIKEVVFGSSIGLPTFHGTAIR